MAREHALRSKALTFVQAARRCVPRVVSSAVVIEVKRDASCSVPQALAELETACANRNVSVACS